MKKVVAIVYGGKSCEHDISIITAMYTYNALDLEEYDIALVYLYDGNFYYGKKLENIDTYIKFDKRKFSQVFFINGKLYDKKKKLKASLDIECVVLCTHGGDGENGSLQGYFDINNIPYTSSKVFSSSLAMDKVMSKKMLESMKYSVLPYVYIKADDENKLASIVDKLNYPVIVKPAKLGSSIGISKCNDAEEAEYAIEVGLKYDNKLLVERCLEDFIEINCAAVRNGNEIVVSLPERPFVTKGYLSYEDKYISDKKGEVCREFPAKIDKAQTEKITQMTRSIYENFELSGVVRIDYLIENNKIFVNEINTIPGSLSYYLFEKQNINISKLVDIMIKQSLKEKKAEDSLLSCFSSQVLQHYKRNKGSNKNRK